MVEDAIIPASCFSRLPCLPCVYGTSLWNFKSKQTLLSTSPLGHDIWPRKHKITNTVMNTIILQVKDHIFLLCVLWLDSEMIPTGSWAFIPGLCLTSLFGDAESGLQRAALSPDLYLVPFLIHQGVRNPYHIFPPLWTNFTALSLLWWTKIRSQNHFFLSYIIFVTYVVTAKQLTDCSTKKELPMLTFSKCEHSIVTLLAQSSFPFPSLLCFLVSFGLFLVSMTPTSK